MRRRKKAELRQIGRAELERRGYATQIRTGQGLLPGARLLASKDGKTVEVGVRTSHQRTLSSTLQPSGRWGGLSVDLVIAVVPAEKNSETVEVVAFDPAVLTKIFEKAREGLEDAGRASRFDLPIFVALDQVSRRKLGHGVSNIKAAALWTVTVGVDELKSPSAAAETFIEKVKREFAEKNEVDVSKVVVEFRILT